MKVFVLIFVRLLHFKLTVIGWLSNCPIPIMENSIWVCLELQNPLDSYLFIPPPKGTVCESPLTNQPKGCWSFYTRRKCAHPSVPHLLHICFVYLWKLLALYNNLKQKQFQMKMVVWNYNRQFDMTQMQKCLHSFPCSILWNSFLPPY